MISEIKSFWICVFLISIAKLLMLKSYISTDFEVHRNWLALTHTFSLQKWYYEDTSEWTLDYPPFFAYFEWMLSYGALAFDDKMLDVKNLNYASNMTILYQKLTVVVTDFVLAYGVLECSKAMPLIVPKTTKKSSYVAELLGLIFVNGGLFMVDHIHFQYNGFLFGILLLSIAKICMGKFYQGAFLFACLLNLKHIFLYIAPAIGIYLLRTCCIKTNVHGVPKSINLRSMFALGGIVVGVAAVSFGPFYQHIPQILQRLFPFKRGLSHAYWAPNIWAAYNSLDLILGYVLKRGKSSSGVTSGLVGESSLVVLPSIQPIHTFLITLIVMMPIMWKLWKCPSPSSFIYAVTLTAWTSFMFGYHVHEKAILNVIIPFSLIALANRNLFFVTLTAGTVSLFPLLFTPFEIVLKAIITVFHLSVSYQIVTPSLKWYETLYILGFLPLYVFENLGDAIIPKFPFLPLLLVSDYTLLGIGSCYISLYLKYVVYEEEELSNSINTIHQKSPRKTPMMATSITASNISPRVLRKRR